MHRSGTSALTRLLNLCGAALPDEILPANAANVTGYWEPVPIVTLHDRWLHQAGSRWDDPLEFPQEWFESPEGRSAADELASTVRTLFGDHPLIAVKDPRACRLVPLWLRALGELVIEPAAVLIVRHPLEVAASLFRRDGLPVALGLHLWLGHVLAAEAATRSCPRVIVTYEGLLDDWKQTVRRIEGGLGLRLPAWEGERGVEIEAEIARFLDPALRHERVSGDVEERRGERSNWIRTAYEWFESAARTGGTGDTAVLDRIGAEVREAERTFAPFVADERRRASEHAARARESETQRGAEAAAHAEQERRWLSLQDQWAQRQRHWQERQTEWETREQQLRDEIERQARAAGDLHQRVLAMERSPFWKVRGRIKALQRLTSRTPRS